MNEYLKRSLDRFKALKDDAPKDEVTGGQIASGAIDCVLISVILSVVGLLLMKSLTSSLFFSIVFMSLILSALVMILLPIGKIAKKFKVKNVNSVRTFLLTLILAPSIGFITYNNAAASIAEQKSVRYDEITQELQTMETAFIEAGYDEYDLQRELSAEELKYIEDLVAEYTELQSESVSESDMIGEIAKVILVDMLVCFVILSVSGSMSKSFNEELKKQMAKQMGENEESEA